MLGKKPETSFLEPVIAFESFDHQSPNHASELAHFLDVFYLDLLTAGEGRKDGCWVQQLESVSVGGKCELLGEFTQE